MGNGKWEMGNGKWEMGNGKWEMGNGKWEGIVFFFDYNTPVRSPATKSARAANAPVLHVVQVNHLD